MGPALHANVLGVLSPVCPWHVGMSFGVDYLTSALVMSMRIDPPLLVRLGTSTWHASLFWVTVLADNSAKDT